jgi:crossover junction endodeoxyribonuclease RuvC
LSFPERIGLLHEKLYQLIGELNPTQIAIEDSFCGNSPKSALKLGQARGALISAIQRHRIPMSEFSPTHVKSSVGGRGGATKDAISKYLSLQFLRDFSNVPWDATDALAIALTGGIAGMKVNLTYQNNRKIDPNI